MCLCGSNGSSMNCVAIVDKNERSRVRSEVSLTKRAQASTGSKPIRIKFLVESQTVGSMSAGDQTQLIDG